MRIHSDIIQWSDVHEAARAARAELRITEHGSRSHLRAFEVKLRGESKRRPNFYDGDDSYAATWDQWGVFFGYLFRVDPNMLAGSRKHPIYGNAAHFHARTFDRFRGLGFPASYHGDHVFRFSGIPYVHACTKCGAMQTWHVPVPREELFPAAG